MKVIVDGQEIELVEKAEPGEKELDREEKQGNMIDLDQTIEITEEEITQIREKNGVIEYDKS